MAERSFEEKAAELRAARDIYMEEGEEGGLEGIGIVPGAPGARPGRGRRIEDEVRDQSNLLKGLREEIQELRKVVSVLKGGLVETSEAFKDFHRSFSQTGREFQEFHKGFGQFVKEFKAFQQDFSQVGKQLREEFGKFLEWVGSLGKVSGQLVKGYKSSVGKLVTVSSKLESEIEHVARELSEVERAVLRARLRKRQIEQQERKQKGGYEYSRLGVGGLKFPKFPGPIVLQERPQFGGLFGLYSGRGYGRRDGEEEKFQLGVWKRLKSLPVRMVFGERGGGGFGKYSKYGGGGMLGEARNIMYAALGPIGVFAKEWMEGLYGRWVEWKEYKKRKEEERLAELASRGIYKVRQIERGKKGIFSDVLDFAKGFLGFGRMGRSGLALSAIGVGAGLYTAGRGVSKFSLSDVELVQERNAKIYADKLHIEAKSVSGVGGGGSILDMLPGGGLLGRFGRFGRWAGRIGLGVGVGLAFLSGVQEGGLGKGIFRGLGVLGGGIGGAKLGALIGTAVAPGIGTAIGSLLGGALGMLGGEKIADAVYSGMKRLIKDKDWVESLGKGFVGVVDRIGNFLKSIVEGVKSGISVVGGVAGKAWGWLKEKIGDLDLGVVARIFEVGEARAAELPKAAGVIAHVKGDPGGMSAGMYQFTKDAQLRFLREYGFMKEFEGARFGTPEWRRRWQEVASKYGERFARAQQEFAVKEYFAPGAAVAEQFGINVKGSRALQEMIFARTIQHGVKGFRNVLRNVFRGMTPEQVRAMSSQEVVTKVYDHLIANVDRYWAKSSPNVREGVRKRLIKEKELLLAIEKQKKEVKKQEGMQKGTTQETGNLYEGMKKQSQMLSGDVILGELSEKKRLYGLTMGGVEGLYQDDIYGLGKWGVGIIDSDVEREQEEVKRRVIGFDVRKEMDVFSSVKDGLEKVLSDVVGKAGGGAQRVIMSGGDAFSKVPLFPEDVGLVMMMLGLV
jgi:hypothetical protein